MAFIAGVAAFGLVPRAVLEIPGPDRRLNRIADLIHRCRYSFHDMSRVQLSGPAPRVPRFNMPFELGLAVDRSLRAPASHQWFVFETLPHRLQRSLSDLNGTDPYVHGGTADGVLVQLSHALVRGPRQPELAEVRQVLRTVRRAARILRQDYGSLFGARAFRELVFAATEAADRIVR